MDDYLKRQGNQAGYTLCAIRHSVSGHDVHTLAFEANGLPGDNFAAFTLLQILHQPSPTRRQVISPRAPLRSSLPALSRYRTARRGRLPKENVAMLFSVDRDIHARLQRVFDKRMTVIGPTPPKNWRCMTRRGFVKHDVANDLPFSRRLIPTSITIAPSLIHSPNKARFTYGDNEQNQHARHGDADLW